MSALDALAQKYRPVAGPAPSAPGVSAPAGGGLLDLARKYAPGALVERDPSTGALSPAQGMPQLGLSLKQMLANAAAAQEAERVRGQTERQAEIASLEGPGVGTAIRRGFLEQVGAPYTTAQVAEYRRRQLPLPPDERVSRTGGEKVGEFVGGLAGFAAVPGPLLAESIGNRISARLGPALAARVAPPVASVITGLGRALGEGAVFGTLSAAIENFDELSALARRDPTAAAKVLAERAGMDAKQFATFSGIIQLLGHGLVTARTLRDVMRGLRDVETSGQLNRPAPFQPPRDGGDGGDGGLGAMMNAATAQRAAAGEANTMRGAIAAERARPAQPALPAASSVQPTMLTLPRPEQVTTNKLAVRPPEVARPAPAPETAAPAPRPPLAEAAPPPAPPQPAVRSPWRDLFDQLDTFPDSTKKELAAQLGVKRATPDDAYKSLLPPDVQKRPLAPGETWRQRALDQVTAQESKAATAHPVIKKAGQIEEPAAAGTRGVEPATPAAPPEGTLRLYLRDRQWVVDWSQSKRADEIRTLFGSDQIVTPFGDKMRGEQVREQIAQKNPGFRIDVEGDIAPQGTVLEPTQPPPSRDLTLWGAEAPRTPEQIATQGTLIAPEPGATKAVPASRVGELKIGESVILGHVYPSKGPLYDLIARRAGENLWTLRVHGSTISSEIPGGFSNPQGLLNHADEILTQKPSIEGLTREKRGLAPVTPKDYRDTRLFTKQEAPYSPIEIKKVHKDDRQQISTSEAKLSDQQAKHLKETGQAESPAMDSVDRLPVDQRQMLTQAIDDARRAIGKNVPESVKARQKWAEKVAAKAYSYYLTAAAKSEIRTKLGTRYGEEPSPTLIKDFLLESETNLAERVAATTGAPSGAPALVTSPTGAMRLSDIVKEIEQRFDIPIREGRLRTKKKGSLGQYDPRQEVIREKLALDIPTASHELGHHLDSFLDINTWPHLDQTTPLLQVNQANYTKAQLVKERVGEFLRVWLTDPAQAAAIAPDFTNEFLTRLSANAPDVLTSLKSIQDMIHTWQTMPAKQRIIGRWRPLEPDTIRLSLRDLWERFQSAFVERLRPWDTAIEKITGGGAARKALGPLKDPYLRGRLLRGATGEPRAWAELGVQDATGRKIGPSLKERLQPAMGQLDDLFAFSVAKHAEELHAQGHKTGFDTRDIRDVIASTPPHLVKVAESLVDYNNHLIDRLVRAGLVDGELTDLWKARHKWYTPFERVFDPTVAPSGGTGQAITGINAPIKSIRGSTRELVHPLESILKRTYGLLQLAQKNEVMRAWYDIGKSEQGQGKWLETNIPQPRVPVKVSLKQLETAITAAGGDLSQANLDAFAEVWLPRGAQGVPKDNIVSVWVDGQLRFMWMHPEIASVAKAMQTTSASVVRAGLRWASATLRAGSTTTLQFILRNVARDPLTQFVLSEKWFVPYTPTIKGLFSFIRKDELYQQFIGKGGATSVLVGMDRNSLLRSIESITQQDKTALQKLGYFARHPIEVLRTLSEAAELSTRLGEMSLHPRGTEEEVAKAVLAAKDVTIDFSRFGEHGRSLNDAKAFWNANVQDLDKIRRTFMERPGQTAAKATLVITVPSIALYLANRVDPEWRAAPRWAKDMFWSVKSGLTRLWWPKPFWLGQIYGTIPERILEWIDTREPEALTALGRNIFLRQAEELVPIPTALLPWLEVNAGEGGYSYFLNRPIVPLSEQRLSPRLQSGPYTSTIAKGIGEMINVSPRKIEYLIGGYTGGLGRDILELPESLGVVPPRPGASARPIEQALPGVKGFVRPPFAQSADVDEFYQALADAKRAVADAQKEGRLPKAAPGQRQRRALPRTPDVVEMRRLVGISNQLSDVRKQIEEILNRPNMDREHKNAAVTLLNRRMVVLARNGLRRSDINPAPKGLERVLGR